LIVLQAFAHIIGYQTSKAKGISEKVNKRYSPRPDEYLVPLD